MRALVDCENLLKQIMGLDSASVGNGTIEAAVRMRMEILGFTKIENYWEKLHTEDNELQELIETVVVPETWFFRDREAFAALARLISMEWLPNHPTAELRMLSGPCCSGEEPYSMAMALVDAGLSPDRLKIDAVDISKRALALAQRGTYGSNSFRGGDLSFRDRHFELTAKGYRLPERIRKMVSFRYGNLLSPDVLVGTSPYDVIFCRNLLIYFDRDTQKRAMKIIASLLMPTGYLFVGPSETFLAASSGFKSIHHSMSFAFRKVSFPATESANVIRPKIAAASGNPIKRHERHTVEAFLGRTHLPATTIIEPIDLETAKQLADTGRLKEAGDLCELHLEQHGPSTQAYYLLGLVRDAAGDFEGAMECYRKVLYLDPVHSEVLLHLALLSEKKGDTGMARRLNERARRAAKQAGEPPSC